MGALGLDCYVLSALSTHYFFPVPASPPHLTAFKFVAAALLIGELRAARQKAEKKQSSSEESFRWLVGGVKDYAIFTLAPSGRVVTWNEGADVPPVHGGVRGPKRRDLSLSGV
jgi:hypothetical protein